MYFPSASCAPAVKNPCSSISSSSVSPSNCFSSEVHAWGDSSSDEERTSSAKSVSKSSAFALVHRSKPSNSVFEE